MTGPTPCLRHQHVWLASCEDCTAWHLSRQITRLTASPHRVTRAQRPAAPLPGRLTDAATIRRRPTRA